MPNWLTDAARGARDNLLTLDDQPVGKAALTVVILLDFFIIVSIFNGLAQHTSQLTSPDEYIPPHCREVVIAREWNETNRLERIAEYVNRYRERTTVSGRVPLQHATCRPISDLFDRIKRDRALADSLKELTRLRNEVVEAASATDALRGVRETRLLEDMTDVEAGVPTPSLERRVAAGTDRIESLAARQEALAASLTEDATLVMLFAHMEQLTAGDRDSLAAAYRTQSFWYPAKRLGMEMVFLVPLVLVFYFWNANSTTKARPFQTLVSSHLLVVVFIPVLFKIFELIFDIIPKRLLKQLFEFLEAIGLVAIWHYFVIAFGIGAAMLLVYLFQQKLFSHAKLLAKRIAKGQCQDCGVQLAAGSAACPQCGFEQYRDCEHCGEPTYVHGPFCRACGR